MKKSVNVFGLTFCVIALFVGGCSAMKRRFGESPEDFVLPQERLLAPCIADIKLTSEGKVKVLELQTLKASGLSGFIELYGMSEKMKIRDIDSCIRGDANFNKRQYEVLKEVMDNKFLTNSLFTGDFAAYRPKWKLVHNLNELHSLDNEILEEISSSKLIIKPLDLYQGEGMLVFERDSLLDVLKMALGYTGENLLPIILSDDVFSIWKRISHRSSNAQCYFLIEEYVPSKYVKKTEKSKDVFDGTMRVIFSFDNSATDLEVLFLGCYWKLPIKPVGKGYGEYISKVDLGDDSSVNVVKVSDEDRKIVYEQLGYVLPEIYRKCLCFYTSSQENTIVKRLCSSSNFAESEYGKTLKTGVSEYARGIVTSIEDVTNRQPSQVRNPKENDIADELLAKELSQFSVQWNKLNQCDRSYIISQIYANEIHLNLNIMNLLCKYSKDKSSLFDTVVEMSIAEKKFDDIWFKLQQHCTNDLGEMDAKKDFFQKLLLHNSISCRVWDFIEDKLSALSDDCENQHVINWFCKNKNHKDKALFFDSIIQGDIFEQKFDQIWPKLKEHYTNSSYDETAKNDFLEKLSHSRVKGFSHICDIWDFIEKNIEISDSSLEEFKRGENLEDIKTTIIFQSMMRQFKERYDCGEDRDYSLFKNLLEKIINITKKYNLFQNDANFLRYFLIANVMLNVFKENDDNEILWNIVETLCSLRSLNKLHNING